VPSHGLSGSELSHNKPWWNGPPFLQLTEDNWPSMMPSDTCEEAQVEIMKTLISHSFVAVNTAEKTPTLHEIITCHNFSSLNRLLRVTVYFLRFLDKLKKCNATTNLTSLSQLYQVQQKLTLLSFAGLSRYNQIGRIEICCYLSWSQAN